MQPTINLYLIYLIHCLFPMVGGDRQGTCVCLYICLFVVEAQLTYSTIYVLVYNIVGEGDGTPLQYSCLENRMDGGAW